MFKSVSKLLQSRVDRRSFLQGMGVTLALPFLESRVVVSGLRHLGRAKASRGCRIVFATDNLTALAVFSRGRSSRPPLAELARMAAALILANGWTVIFRWVESRRNHSDAKGNGEDDSRHSRQHPQQHSPQPHWRPKSQPLRRWRPTAKRAEAERASSK